MAQKANNRAWAVRGDALPGALESLSGVTEMGSLKSHHLMVLAMLTVNSILVWSLSITNTPDPGPGDMPALSNNSAIETGHENSLAVTQLSRQLSDLSESVETLRTTRFSPGPGQQEWAETPVTLELERLSAAMERLYSSQESLNRKQAELARSLTTLQSGNIAEVYEDSAPTQPAHERLAERIQELEYNLAAEPLDREFANRLKDDLVTDLDASGITTMSLVETACSATSCRVNLDLSTFEDPMQVFPDLMRMLPGNAGGQVHTDENDPNQVAIYFNRLAPYN